MNHKRLAHLFRYALAGDSRRRQWFLIIVMTLLGSAMTLLAPWPMKVLIDHVLQQQPLSGWAPQILGPVADSRTGLLAFVIVAGVAVFAINSVSDGFCQARANLLPFAIPNRFNEKIA